MFNIEKIQGYLVAKSPIHHGGDEKTGSETLFNHQRIYIEETNKTMDVPYISGNAIRGVWRRLIMADLLKQLDYKTTTSTYHSLFSGGVLRSVSEEESGTINLELQESLLSLVKPLDLLGMSYRNQILKGKLQIGQVIPICREYKERLPNDLSDKYLNRLEKSYNTFLDFLFQTRRDDLHEAREEGEQAIQMLVRYQVMITGTAFYHELRLLDSDELNRSVLARILELWSANPTIGGKASVGFGELEVQYNFNATSKEYLQHIKNNKSEIIQILESIK